MFASSASWAHGVPITKVEELRLQGRLVEAIDVADRQIAKHAGDRIVKIEYHLELARIYDRIGLHNNSRPVADSFANIDAAASLADSMDSAALADIELARADYFAVQKCQNENSQTRSGIRRVR